MDTSLVEQKLLAADGYNLVIVARHENDLIRVANEIKATYDVEVVLIAKDLFDPDNAFELYNQVKTNNILVEILTNDAGQDYMESLKIQTCAGSSILFISTFQV